MNAMYGPMGEHVKAFIDALGRLAAEEAKGLGAAWFSTWVAVRVSARASARIAALNAARGPAWGAARGAVWATTTCAAWGTAWDAVAALAVLDLAARDAELRESCETLLAPARTVPALNSIIEQAWEHAETIAKEN